MKRILVGLLAIASLVLLLAGCGKEETKPAADAPIKVGVSDGVCKTRSSKTRIEY